MYYTTKTVPERYLIDNEKENDFRGMPKVCEIAHFLCENAHSAQKFLLILVKSTSDFYTNQFPFTFICEGEIYRRADVFLKCHGV